MRRMSSTVIAVRRRRATGSVSNLRKLTTDRNVSHMRTTGKLLVGFAGWQIGDPTACTPVPALVVDVLAIEEALVDEIPPQRRPVGMEREPHLGERTRA